MTECLKKVLDDTMEFYLKIPNDNILKYIQGKRRPKSARSLLHRMIQEVGLALIGQWLSAFSRMYAISGNEAFRKKAVFLADEFWSCYDAAASSEPFLTSRSHYDLEKLLRAHCDLHLYCAYPQARKRGEFLVDFAYCNLTCDNLFGDNSTEWYTLTESFWDAYDILGIPDAIKLAERFAYREFWDLFYIDADPFSRRPEAGLYSEYCHAYSHVKFL